ncbi:MAG: glycoside hydrolase family 88 protein, partial [Gammaproteobacteria bacterium]|nr:glycoside hydrolase family 88 protein [Gammaproteobacteria bacterium]
PRNGTEGAGNRGGRVSLLGKRSYFDKVGVLVSRPGAGSSSRLAVTIKAGGNGSHSHNDIGSYSIGVGSKQPVGDPGGLRYYSKRSFGARRYASNVLNSYGHPVPVVAGHLQLNAAKVKPRVLETYFTDVQDEISIDMASAYAVPGLTALKRTMRYDRAGVGSVEIADQFEFASPNTFEVALTTVGKWKRVSANVIAFISGKEMLKASIETPGAFDLVQERIKENGTEFERIGIRLRDPLQSGTIQVRFVPSR